MSAMFQQLLQAPHMSISRLVAIAGLMQPPVIIIAWLNPHFRVPRDAENVLILAVSGDCGSPQPTRGA
jgi:hypothetical protein